MTEEYFNLSDPNRTSIVDENTGVLVDLVPISDFFNFTSEVGVGVTIVLPTKDNLGVVRDNNGDRFPEFDVQEVKDFIALAVSGAYGNAQIEAFEIGNEYWGSGKMTSVEYGRLASEMSSLVREVLDELSQEVPDASLIDVIVQSGVNNNYSRLDEHYSDVPSGNAQLAELSIEYGYSFDDSFLFSSGNVNWTKVNNQLIINQFTLNQILELDGVATHIYSKGEGDETARDWNLKIIDQSWEDLNPELATYVTEWNMQSRNSLSRHEDYGLKNARELLEIMEEFSAHGVSTAQVWPLLQSTKNSLSHGFEYDELSPAGEMFRLMQGSLPGTEPIDLLGSKVRQNEVDFEGVGVHAFGNSDKLVLFLYSQKDELIDLAVDLSDLFLEFSAIEIDYLGVREGENPGSNRSTAEVNSLDEAAISEVFNDGELSVHLDSHEIMRVVVHNPVWSVELDQFWSRNGDTSGDNTIFGGEGADTIDGGTGNDHLDGGEGGDALYGGGGADTLIGGEGNDRLIGGESKADVRDVIYAGDGDDFVVGGYGNDELRGDEGNDTIEGGFGADTLIGGDGDDVLAGSAWSDEISGGGGDDFVHGGFGNDRVNGGAGGDRFFHVGIMDHGSDWVQDYDASEGDVLVFGNTSATADQFQVNFTETDNAGEAGVEEAFIIYRPTGQIMWALVDGEAQDEIMLRIAGVEYDLLG